MVFIFFQQLGKKKPKRTTFCDFWNLHEILILVSIKFYWKTTTLSCLHINYGCFCTTMAKLQRLVMLQRWHGPQTLNIDYLALYRKHLLGVPCQSRGWDSILSLGVRRGIGLISGRGPTKCTKWAKQTNKQKKHNNKELIPGLENAAFMESRDLSSKLCKRVMLGETLLAYKIFGQSFWDCLHSL